MINLTTNRLRAGSQKKLLLIEDDASVVESLSLLLKQDYEVHSESTIASGVRRFRKLAPALVVLDLRLPDGDGLEVLREIRRADSGTPVVVLTGYASMRTIEESLRLGASDYLHKPFDGFALKSRIDELLPSPRRRKAERRSPSLKLADTQQKIAALKLKADASSMFLHDVAGPMTAALTCSHYLCALVEKNHPADEDTMEMVELLMNAMGFLSGLFKQRDSIECLTPLPVSVISVSKVLNLALGMVKSKARTRKIVVDLDLKQSDTMIRVNRFALARVLMNLLNNAIEAVQPETGRVTLTSDISNGFVTLSVLDNGPGISPTTQERVFEPRFTTKSEGSGLGLYISKRLMASMGGELSLRSKFGHGCCFSIKLSHNL